MASQKYWDELFDKVESLSDEEFEKIVSELDETEDIPFAIHKDELQLILCDYLISHNELDSKGGLDLENYNVDLYYKDSSDAFYNVLGKYNDCFEAA